MNNLLKMDKLRYFSGGGKVPLFQIYFRKCQGAKTRIGRLFYRVLFCIFRRLRGIELSSSASIGPGLYFGHAYGITINPKVKLGRNINIHKGVTIGQENRGLRKGVPVIGNNVWIGVNSTIVGKIRIGDDVLIAPNTYINCDISDHSVVFGNPCIIKHRDNATEGYLNHIV